jgi:hypothetical protein
MVADNAQVVAKLVQERLRTPGPVGSRLRVVAEDVVRQTSDGVWWYVPVSIQRDPARMGEIYYTLSSVEDRIEEEDHVAVLLVPRILPVEDSKAAG